MLKYQSICCASRFRLRVMASQVGLEEIIQGDEEGGMKEM